MLALRFGSVRLLAPLVLVAAAGCAYDLDSVGRPCATAADCPGRVCGPDGRCAAAAPDAAPADATRDGTDRGVVADAAPEGGTPGDGGADDVGAADGPAADDGPLDAPASGDAPVARDAAGDAPATGDGAVDAPAAQDAPKQLDACVPVPADCTGKCGVVLGSCGVLTDCGDSCLTTATVCGGGGTPNVCGCPQTALIGVWRFVVATGTAHCFSAGCAAWATGQCSGAIENCSGKVECTCPSSFSISQVTGTGLAPIYRCQSGTATEYLLTTNLDCSPGIGNPQVMGYMATAPVCGAYALYAKYDPNGVDRKYVAYSEAVTLDATGWYDQVSASRSMVPFGYVW